MSIFPLFLMCEIASCSVFLVSTAKRSNIENFPSRPTAEREVILLILKRAQHPSFYSESTSVNLNEIRLRRNSSLSDCRKEVLQFLTTEISCVLPLWMTEKCHEDVWS
ncbi:unnamed protein product [Ceratitis capitata]|uniref:(Mediterranean fruit fly) hypothetical protein n=1 Tax=Ceratitis capitata TaxID=7213 RepID=A0A811UNN5_CERCA|nr:unnamed protein product [Ceratitis capitata]